MNDYRIRKSPSGRKFRIQQLKQTLGSRFLRGLFYTYPRQYCWKYVTRVNGEIVECHTREHALQLINELQIQDMDSKEENWSIIQV